MSRTAVAALVIASGCGRLGFGTSMFDGGGVCYGSVSQDIVCLTNGPSEPVSLVGAIDTTSGSPQCSTDVVSGPVGCVIAGTTIVVGAVTVTGSRPLILIADTKLTIVELLDVSSHGAGSTGPGANVACASPIAPAGGSGGAGGSFGAMGGMGGADQALDAVGMPASPITPAAIRGGCPGDAGGAGGAGGDGGGGVLLIASTLEINGVINASGAGGRGAPNGGMHGGGGGGSGGMIAIDAATTSGTGTILANGGGGGGGTAAGSQNGTDGNEPTPSQPLVPALGGNLVINGGAGGAGTMHDGGAGQASGPNPNGGGGGGGSVGIIESYRATFSSGIVSPS